MRLQWPFSTNNIYLSQRHISLQFIFNIFIYLLQQQKSFPYKSLLLQRHFSLPYMSVFVMNKMMYGNDKFLATTIVVAINTFFATTKVVVFFGNAHNRNDLATTWVVAKNLFCNDNWFLATTFVVAKNRFSCSGQSMHPWTLGARAPPWRDHCVYMQKGKWILGASLVEVREINADPPFVLLFAYDHDASQPIWILYLTHLIRVDWILHFVVNDLIAL